MAAWPHQIHLSDPVIHCHICVPGQLAVTPTRSPDLSDRSHGAKTETDFVMTHPDNKNILVHSNVLDGAYLDPEAHTHN